MSNQLNLVQMESNQVRLTDDQWKKDTPDLKFECQGKQTFFTHYGVHVEF